MNSKNDATMKKITESVPKIENRPPTRVVRSDSPLKFSVTGTES